MIRNIVIDYQTEEVLYYGPGVYSTAMRREPGTVFGQGENRVEAMRQAVERAQKARETHYARIT